MEKALKLYTYVDGINDAPFPSLEEQVEIKSFTYDAKRMGGAPNITFTVRHRLCLDNIWTDKVYASFNDERYYLKQIPTSVFDSTDNRYRHEVELVSERIVLENVYFFDVVSLNVDNDKPVSNSSNVVFFGDINEFASRLNSSLKYSHLDYSVVVDDGVSSDSKLMSFNDQFFANVLQEIYNTYDIPYYFVGKEIHIGNDEHEVDQVFEYGIANSLVSISKENANYKIVNRCTGDGSSDNIPYYYPNPSPYGRINVLYNNKLSDNVTITDWSKFSAYGPASILKYEITENETERKSVATLDDFKTQEVLQTSVLIDQPIYTWVGKYSMKVEEAKAKIYISFGSKVEYAGAITYSIKDDNGVKIAYGMFPTINGLELGYGSYDVYINIGVGNRQSTAEEYARSIAEASISLSSFKYLDGWRLNDKRLINLSSMGITMLGTPQVNDIISFEIAEERVPIVGKLMPSLYRETKGSDRFYNALNDTYVNPDDKPHTYVFSNPYIDSNPREHIVHFEDIKPTIKGMINAVGERIDMFVDFAYDLNDNDEVDENGKYEHPYFYAKLRKFDGEYGFNLFSHAIEGNPMTIAMTSGSCGACEWTIGVDDKSNLNVVQVYEEDTTDADGVFHKAGTLKRNDNGDVLRSGVAQDIQNDTRTHEVWIALKKEESTFGVLMPNANHNYCPSINDTFVILHISLPESYILAAEQRLTEAIIKYMSENNDDKFNFSIKFSRIFLEQNPQILEVLNENSLIKIKYNDSIYPLHVSSYSYKMTDNAPLPEVIVQLSDTITINRSPVQNTLNEIKNANYRASYVSENGASTQTSIGLTSVAQASKNVVGPTIIELGLTEFVRKQGVDNISDVKIFHDEVILNNGVRSGDFSRGGLIGSGWGIYKDEYGRTVAEIDKIVARHVLELNDLKINQSTYEKGAQILSSGGCVVEAVEEYDDYYRCYFDNKQGTFFSGFVVGDIARCQRFDESYAKIVNDYRRSVVGVSASYVDLSKSESYGDGIPSNGDTIIHFGNTIDKNRQYIIIRDVIGGGYERMLSDLNSVSATGVEYYFAGRVNGETPRWFVGNNEQFIEYKDGHLQINADVTLGSGSDLSASEEYKKLQDDIKGLQNQIDGKVEAFYFNYDPSNDTYPTNEWTTDELKEEHLNDTFTNTESGQSWRWLLKDGVYQWVAISDTQALQMAQDALNLANSKVTIFTETPTPPYKVKDLWFQGEGGNTKRCIKARTEQETYNADDWVNADDYKAFASSVASDAENNAKAEIGTFDYLKQAMAQNTTLSGGLVQTTLLQLGYRVGDNLIVQSGTNGIYNSALKGGGIASWWGGDMLDKEVEGVTGRVAQALLRMDGTGYLAGGNITWDLYGAGSVAGGNLSWDKDGNITLSDNIRISSDKDETLGTVLTSISKLQSSLTSFKSLFDSMFEKDSDGNIHAKLSLWSSGGITAGGVGSGGSGGGGGISYNRLDSWSDYSADKSGWVLSALLGKDLDNRVSALANAGYITQSALAPYALRSEIPSLVGYATQSWVGDNYLSKNGGTINGSTTLSIGNLVVSSGDTVVGKIYPRTDNEYTLGQDTRKWKNILCYNINGSTPVNASNLKSTLGISDWALASVKPTYTASEVGAMSVYGGTINSPSLASLVINRNNSTGASVITFTRNSDFTHFLGFNDNSGPKWLNADYQEYPLLHSGNYSSYALPITGGTVNGSITAPSFVGTLNGQATAASLLRKTTSSNTWCVANGNALEIYNSNWTKRFWFGYSLPEGSPYATNEWHFGASDGTGNDSGKVYASSFIGNLVGVADKSKVLGDYYGERVVSANLDFTDSAVRKIIATSSMTTAKPPADGSILHFAWDNAGGWNHQLYICSNSLVEPNKRMAWRAQYYGVWGAWQRIAFSDSNVASATKLATARNIFGQSFDGTKSITGNEKSIGLDSVNAINNDPNSWVDKYSLKLESSNNAMTFLVDNTENSRKAMIQVGHHATAYAGYLGNLYLNPLGGNVAIGGKTADEKLHVHGNGLFAGNIILAPTDTSDVSILFRSGTLNDAAYDYKIGKFTDANGKKAFGMAMAKSNGSWVKFLGVSTDGAYNVSKIDLLTNVEINGTLKTTGALTAPSITANSLTIGGATITYDSVNKALCINGNMYALGGITAGGAGISAYTSLESRVARIEQQLNIS